MNSDTILTFQAPGRESARVLCTASPVLELAYAVHYLLVRVSDVDARDHDVGWVGPLLDEQGDLVRALRAFGARHGVDDLSPMLLMLAARYDYERDAGPERFIRDLTALPGRFLEGGIDAGDGVVEGDDRSAREAAFRDSVARFAEEPVAAELRELVTRLWEALAPAWQREGRETVEAAVASFEATFERTQSVLESLPPHHFTRFEQAAHGIRDREQRGRIVVIPLYFASTGGFNFQVDDGYYVGFGLQSETVFERTAQQVTSLAQRVKALADPTRLLALALVGRFSTMRMTVGDLADQIGVSQPTLSGHLKLLREAGLVCVERHGNKSFYSLERSGVRQLLEELDTTLLD
jgi:ArsR family transcriptional regulator, arsenate/arsenite/antimonite-responsive transcriptional repressor